MMDFETWLIRVGKSARSAKSYAGAVSGVISTWAIDAGLTNCSLIEIQSAKQYSQLVNNIKNIEIFQARNTKGNGMYSSALNAYADYLADITSEDIQEDITDLLDDPTIDKTEKAMLVNARVGQGKFRQKLIDQWQGCALTGYGDSRFLVASHIKSWRDSNNQERLDPFNGLLLLPNLDKVFDLGFITFSASGNIMISHELENAPLLGVRPGMVIKLNDRRQEYMAYHREDAESRGRTYATG
jgi:predicted restriction endonuclease